MSEHHGPKALYILRKSAFDMVYGQDERADIEELADVYAPPQTAKSILEDPALLQEVEVIFSGWGAPTMDAAFLAAAPNLKAVFYGAGSVRKMVTDALWDRGIVVSSAYGANAIPVAEYCVSQVLFCLKQGWRHVRGVREQGTGWKRLPVKGAYGTTVGLVSLGMIGRATLRLLHPYDVDIAVYSTSLTPEQAEEMNVRLCGLNDIFADSDVVSLHTPSLPETKGMIRGSHFESMPEGAAFINTARGAVVNEPDMIEVLKKRPDLTVVLDVTDPEPPVEGSPLYSMPNVVLTPHIAGSLGQECQRLGRYVADEFRRHVNGEPLEWEITRDMAKRLA